MNTLRTNSLKLIAFITRAVVLFQGLLLTLVSALAFLSPQYSKKAEYILALFAGIILIYPFRLLKTARSIKIYFYVLLSVTLAILLPMSANLNPEYGKPDITFPIALILNVIIVLLYYLHRQNIKLINPLLEKKAIKRILKLTLGLFLLLIGIGAYLFLDIKDTPTGKQYITIPGIIPEFNAQFTKEALNSSYKLRSSTYLEPRTMHVEINKRDIDKMNGGDFIELYVDNRKVYRVDYDKTGVKQAAIFDINGNSEQADPFYKLYGITKEGEFVAIPEEERYTAITNLDMIIYPSISTYRSGETNDSPFKDLVITINNSVGFPKRKIKILPFKRTSQNWNLVLKDSKSTVQLVNKILIWY